MTGPDFDRIESALGLTLPPVYRRLLSPFPAAHEEGNTTSLVWDDADALIDLNRALRTGVPDWPPWLFAIGQSERDPSGWGIDTRDEDAPVWWLEQMRLGPHSGFGPGSQRFREWFEDTAADLDVPPSNDRELWWGVWIWLVLSSLGVLACLLWIAWRA